MYRHRFYRRQAVLALAVLAAGASPLMSRRAVAGGLALAPATAPRLTLDITDLPPATSSATAPDRDLTQLSLEDLMSVEITSVSRQPQRIGDAPAAIYVITQDDIRRSGMVDIPDLLRMAPGLQVGQVDPGVWMVGSRGFNQVRSNNLLVLVDGRTVYTPLFSGVYWDMVDYILEDLDRIEVIRGPGGTLWGSNAVNGVINITSKSARDTQGLLVHDYSGTDGYIGAIRYGGNVDNHIFYRVYAKYRTMDDMPDPANRNIADGWDSQRYGFRVDADLSERDKLTLQGDTFVNRQGRTYNHYSLTPPSTVERSLISNTTGNNLLARYTHTFSENSDLSLQAYYDDFNLSDHNNEFHQHTYDFEFQHRFPLAGFQEIIWGGGYRAVADHIEPEAAVTVDGDYADPRSRYNSLVSGFVQDDFTVVPKRLHLIVGTKLEMTPYAGFEFQPSARVAYTPNERNTLWAGVSRAVRALVRWETDTHVQEGVLPTPGLPTSIDLMPNRRLRSEQLLSLEAGYRTEPVANLSFDLAAFYNFHHGVEEIVPAGAPFMAGTPIPHVIMPVTPFNEANGTSYGAELSARWKPTDKLQLQASYSYLGVHMQPWVANDNGAAAGLNGAAPAQQAQFHVYYDITKDLQVNGAAYYVSGIDAPQIPGYVRADLNVVWRPEMHVELMAGVRNLLDAQHPEYMDRGVRSTSSEVPRTLFLELNVRF